jgi:hypothetical protein
MLSGRHAEAERLVDGTIAHCRRSGDAFALPELLRIKARALKALGADDAVADAALEASLALSREQGARAWTLRATMDQARWLLERGERPRAREMLAPWMEDAGEGAGTLDRRELEQLWREAFEAPARA